MNNEITASPETLLEQAPMIAKSYLYDAIDMIDGKLGKGFAKKNPQLLGQFIQAAASDCNACTLAKQIRLGLQEGLQAVADAIFNASLRNGNGKALVESLNESIGESLSDIANAIRDHK